MAYQLPMAGRQADRFRDVQSRIDSYLILFPIISHIGITRRLDRIYSILVADSACATSSSSSAQMEFVPQEPAEFAQEVLPHGTAEFTLAEIVRATRSFAHGYKIGFGGFGMVYMGRLSDGRDVVIKRAWHPISSDLNNQFSTEIAILSLLRHKHIVRLLGTSWSMDNEFSTEIAILSLLRRKKLE